MFNCIFFYSGTRFPIEYVAAGIAAVSLFMLVFASVLAVVVKCHRHRRSHSEAPGKVEHCYTMIITMYFMVVQKKTSI